MKRIVTVGELNADVIVAGIDHLPEPGGAGSAEVCLTLGSSSGLFACQAARLGHPTALAARVGDDTVGAFLLDCLDRAGVDRRFIAVEAGGHTGICVCLATGAERTMVSNVPRSALTRPSDIDDVPLDSFDHLHQSSWFLLRSLSDPLYRIIRRAKDSGLTVSVDPGWDSTGRWDGGFRRVMELADILFVNQAEAAGITGLDRPDEALLELNRVCPVAVIKMGKEGAVAAESGTTHRQPAFPIEAVDATGAGDAFDAGFVSARLSGMDLRTCLRLGSACGAMVAGSLGGFDGQPDAEAVRGFLEQHPGQEGKKASATA